MSVDKKFQKLDDIDHVILRPGMYIGSIKPHKSNKWIIAEDKMVQKELNYNPGLLKIFDEIITNSVSSLNNTFIQYEAPGLLYPINTLSDNGFTKINLILYIQTIDNVPYSVQLPAGGGYCNIKFVLKRLKKKKV